MDIRLMKIDDYDQIILLWTQTAGMGLRSMDDSQKGIATFLLRNPNTSFVAVEGERIIGTILCGHDGRRGFFYHVTVAENCRKKGIGKKLVDQACNALKKEGIHKCAFIVYRENEPGNAFWRSLGWEQREDLNYYNLSLNENNQ